MTDKQSADRTIPTLFCSQMSITPIKHLGSRLEIRVFIKHRTKSTLDCDQSGKIWKNSATWSADPENPIIKPNMTRCGDIAIRTFRNERSVVGRSSIIWALHWCHIPLFATC